MQALVIWIMTYTNIMNTAAAIIPVAGLSSRMGRFKPLLELNGFPLIRLSVQSAFDGGVQSVILVTGKRASEIETALSCKDVSVSQVQGLKATLKPRQNNVCFVHNSEFAQNDMMYSIKLGLTKLLAAASGTSHSIDSSTPQAVFIFPGDMPGISPQTFTALQKERETADSPVLVPTYNGQRGHPLLVNKECFENLLVYKGEGGLKHALAGFIWQEVEVDDPGILLDADDPAAFEKLQPYISKIRGVHKSIVDHLFSLYQTPHNVQAHTRAVAEVALRMAQALNKQCFGLDSELCRSGALLHDLNRLEHDHSQVAAAHLRDLGYEALSVVVGAHDRELVLSPRMFTEANIVFVSDKLVKETTLVRINRRYEGALKRFPPTTELGKLIKRDSESAIRLLTCYVEATGDHALLEGTEQLIRESYAKT